MTSARMLSHTFHGVVQLLLCVQHDFAHHISPLAWNLVAALHSNRGHAERARARLLGPADAEGHGAGGGESAGGAHQGNEGDLRSLQQQISGIIARAGNCLLLLLLLPFPPPPPPSPSLVPLTCLSIDLVLYVNRGTLAS